MLARIEARIMPDHVGRRHPRTRARLCSGAEGGVAGEDAPPVYRFEAIEGVGRGHQRGGIVLGLG